MDPVIRKNVEDELSWQPKLRANEIGVGVKSGIVTLSGTVNSYDKELAAEKAALRVVRVRGIANDITVKLPTDSWRTDAELADIAASALTWNAAVPAGKIKVMAEKGWLTLTGDVEWRYQSDEAYKSVSKLTGVNGVINEVKVKPQLSPEGLKAKIVVALERNAETESKQINVEVDGSTVTLTGSVPTWHQRKQAENAAWAATGVAKVINRLEIAVPVDVLEEY